MASAPTSINPVSAAAASIPVTGGPDAGVGFHSEQPISIERFDPTEQTQFKNKLEEQQQDIKPEPVQVFPKYLESPFTRYVSRPLSNGDLSHGLQTFKPEDRSHMGTPLNPFWIRNDLWSMNQEADIFADAGPNWVAPRVQAGAGQSLPGYDRSTYLDNQEQPQSSTQAAPIQESRAPAPAAPAAGTVTSSAVAAQQGDMSIPESNPAVTNKDEDPSAEPKEGDMKAAGEIKVGDSMSLDGEPSSPKKKASRKRSKKNVSS